MVIEREITLNEFLTGWAEGYIQEVFKTTEKLYGKDYSYNFARAEAGFLYDIVWASNPNPSGSLPTGLIAMWSGLKANIPSEWALCDGTQGTPDLRDKFIVGTPDGEEAGVIGGSLSKSHSGVTVQDHPALTHIGGAVDPHSGMAVGDHANVAVPATATAAVKIGTAGATGAAQTHTHTISSIVHSVTQAINHVFTQPNQHAIQAHTVTQPDDHTDIRPPFFKLAFIMKL